jgi:hypothetical protein
VWIIREWQCISPGVTVKGFEKFCISNAVDGTDDMLWSDSEEDGSECEENEGTDCSNGDSDTHW